MMTHLIAYGILLIFCSIAAVIDHRTKRIPNALVFTGTGTGILFSVYWGDLLPKMAALLILFIVPYLFYGILKGMLGMGDIKLWMMDAAFLGLVPSFIAFTISQISLLLYALWKGKRHEILAGLRTFLLYRLKPEAADGYPLGVHFLIGTVITVLLIRGGIL